MKTPKSPFFGIMGWLEPRWLVTIGALFLEDSQHTVFDWGAKVQSISAKTIFFPSVFPSLCIVRNEMRFPCSAKVIQLTNWLQCAKIYTSGESTISFEFTRSGDEARSRIY